MNITLDYPSIILFLALNNLFIITLLIYKYWFHHKQWYLLLVILGIAFQTMAIILFGKRDLLPYLYTIRINNFLLITSFALTSFGLLSFDGKLRKNLLRTFVVFVVLFYTSILIVEENYTTLTIIRIISCSFFYGIGAFYLFVNKKQYKFPIILSLVLFIYSIFQLVRAFNIYTMDQNYDLLKGSVLGNWFLVITLFVISASSIGFIMLLKEIDEKTILTNNLIIQKDKLKLETLNRTQNKLFSIIAHDLRSPFNNIIGLSELLLENVKETNDTESEKCVGFINSTAENTLNLLDNLLHWAKSQTGELLYKPEKIILSDFILEIIGLQTSLANAKNISLQYSSTEDIEVYTDENILATILRNLISNAVKFTNPEGHINVSATINEHQVEISVADNGVGMSEETIQKIFDPSIKVTSKGTANENGSGFGLVLCREFVEKLDGQLLIESEEGKGSNFKFTLPYGKESN